MSEIDISQAFQAENATGAAFFIERWNEGHYSSPYLLRISANRVETILSLDKNGKAEVIPQEEDQTWQKIDFMPE